jgi:GTPase SAR1 family protein
MGSSSALSSGSYDLSFKILLIGDSNVGKTRLIVNFVSDSTEPPLPTVGTFFFISSLRVAFLQLFFRLKNLIIFFILYLNVFHNSFFFFFLKSFSYII